MTSPKLVTNPPQGSGLIGQLVDAHYEDLARGRSPEQIPAACILKPVGHSSRTTKDGVHRTVTYEVVRLEPMRDTYDADQVTWLVTRAHDLRHGGDQLTLPVNSPSEMRASIEAALADWASREDVTQDQLNERFVDYFGGPEHAATDDVSKGSLAQLQEFAGHVGAIDDPYAKDEPTPAGDDNVLRPPFASAEDPTDDGAEPDDDATPDAES